MAEESEEIILAYHKGIELLSKLSLLKRYDLQQVQKRFREEAARSSSADSGALRSLVNACQIYLDDEEQP